MEGSTAVSGAPIMVLGVGRSGTTLLKEMLDHHSEVAIPPESYFLPLLWGRYRLRRNVESLLEDLRYVVQLREWRIGEADVRARLPADPGFPDVIRAIYLAYAESRGKRRFGDKTPYYMRHLDLLEHAFSRPRYVHIVRDGRDAALSFRSMARAPARGLEWPRGLTDFAYCWRYEIIGARRLGTEVAAGRYVEVQYEDLVRDPEATLREVCAGVGLSYEPAMLEYHRDFDFDLAAGGYANHPRLAEAPSPAKRNWRERMAPEDVLRFEAVAGDLLTELGYDRAFPRLPARARARARIAAVRSAIKVRGARLQLELGGRTPVWRWRYARKVQRAGYEV